MMSSYKAMLHRMFLLFVMSNASLSFGSIVVQGNADVASNTSFTFPIAAHATSSIDGSLYVGATAAGGQTFALSKLPPTGNETNNVAFIPFAPVEVTLDFQAGQPNPLYNNGISFLDVLSAAGQDRVAVVTNNPAQAANLYLTEFLTNNNPLTVYSVTNIADANGQPSNGIIGIAATNAGRSGVFAAVLPNGSNTFGDPGSGIALVAFSQVTIDEGNNVKKTTYTFQQAPAAGNNTPIAAAALNRTSPQLFITDPLASLTNVVDMYWDPRLQCLFIAVQAQAGANANDGAYGVVVGQVVPLTDANNNVVNVVMQLTPIAPTTIFTAGAQNEIIGGVAANTQVSIERVATMRTSTRLDYLIVVGGNGSPETTQSNVYALPLVNTINAQGQIANAATQGTLAATTSSIVPIFKQDSRFNTFQLNEFSQPATTPDQIFTTASVQAQVGQGALPVGAITDMIVAQDTVFVSVATASGGQLPGVYYSQALFDATGAIKNWTQWRRVGAIGSSIFGMGYNAQLGNFTWLTGASSATINTVEKTIWSTGDAQELAPLGTLLTTYFTNANGGVQGLHDFPLSTPGLSTMTFMAATGAQTVMLTQTGVVNSGVYTPITGSAFANNIQSFTSGVINNGVDAQTVIIGGGTLATLDAIVTSDIGVANNNAWLFVGGTGGLAVLANADGTGWNATTGLLPSFTNLAQGMSFKIIGNYSFVRSVIADGNFLYVLTDTTFDRINMSTSNFATNTLSVTTLATPQALQIFQGNRSTLLSCVVSGKFAALSTTAGLFTIGSGADATVAQSPAAMSWTPVTVNEAAGSVIQLVAVSPTGRAQDVARFGGGAVYALNGYTGQSRGQINRFAVADVSASPITSSTFQAYPDIFIQGIPSSFKNLGSFANQYATDGSLNLYSRCGAVRTFPFVKNIQPGPARNDIPVFFDINGNSTISSMLRTFASGSWMVVGDFVRFNE